MTVIRVESQVVHEDCVRTLGLDPTLFDLDTTEALCALMRLTAAYATPCPSSAIRGLVEDLLEGLVDQNGLSDRLARCLDDLVGYGDLLELRRITSDAENGVPLIFLGPPRHVRLSDHTILLVGVEAEGATGLTEVLSQRITYAGHRRVLYSTQGEDLGAQLSDCGFPEMARDLWLKAPPPADAARFVKQYETLLAGSQPAGTVTGLEVLDPETNVRYYRGRWKPTGTLSGLFVARREQRYGNPLWCFIELRSGEVVHLVDLGREYRGCDEAWHLQMAIDATRAHPQQYRLSSSRVPGSVLLECFSPIPQWAQRHLDALGEPVSGSGSLFAYQINASEGLGVTTFLEEHLWLRSM